MRALIISIYDNKYKGRSEQTLVIKITINEKIITFAKVEICSEESFVISMLKYLDEYVDDFVDVLCMDFWMLMICSNLSPYLYDTIMTLISRNNMPFNWKFM